LPEEYYAGLAAAYAERRDRLVSALEAAGLAPSRPTGAYYVMADFSRLGFDDDRLFAEFLVKKAGVAAVPGSSFYVDPADGRRRIRFNFCKRHETLDAAAARLARLPALARSHAG